MGFTKIEASEIVGRKISELPDVPELTAEDLKRRFDAISQDVIIPKFNNLVDELEAETGADNIGIAVPEGLEAENKLSAVIAGLAVWAKLAFEAKHSHDNEDVLALFTEEVKSSYDKLVSLFMGITHVSDIVSNSSEIIPTGKAIAEYAMTLGAGDMVRAVYDADDNGVIDDSERLGGHLPEHYATAEDVTAIDDELKKITSLSQFEIPASSWTLETDIYKYSIEANVKEGESHTWYMLPSNGLYATDEDADIDALLKGMVCHDGSIVFYAGENISTDISLVVEGIE